VRKQIMSDEQFMLDLSRRCFRLARACRDSETANEIGQIGQALLARAQRDAALTIFDDVTIQDTPSAAIGLVPVIG